MQRFILSFALFSLAAACAAQEEKGLDPDSQRDVPDLPDLVKLEPDCDPHVRNGKVQRSGIKYGDAFVIVTPIHGVARGKQWRIRLRPKQGYDNAMVTIKGKDPDSSWIDKTAVASIDSVVVICVPDDLVLGNFYRYYVTVENVGTIDPRVTVDE
jgi:hypothetical protein